MSRTPAIQKRIEGCPNREQHTEGPEGYLHWHEWAEKKGKTHKQKRCPGCRLFLIWEPKPVPVQSKEANHG